MPPSPDPVVRLDRRGPAVAIFAEPRDSHALALGRAFRRLGVSGEIVRFDRCGYNTVSPARIVVDRFDRLPDAVFVRTIPGGSFEAVTLRLGLLHALRELGIPVWNDARAIERCVDKAATSFHLAKAGIPTPPAWAVTDRAAALAILDRELPQGPLVWKPLFGSQGRGLLLLNARDDLPEAEAAQGAYYLQRFVGNDAGGYHDYRVLVSGRRALAAMRRRGTGWITNVKRGGRPEAVALSPVHRKLALDASRAVGADFCGVDIVEAPGRGPMVLEVNSMPAWSGLQTVVKANLAAEIARDFIAAAGLGLKTIAGDAREAR